MLERQVRLPPGFRLEEDDHFVYLFYGGTQVAVFSSSGVDPEEIEKAAERYLREKRGGK